MKRTADRRQKPEVGGQMTEKSWGSGDAEFGKWGSRQTQINSINA
jgi:hypothetical protein